MSAKPAAFLDNPAKGLAAAWLCSTAELAFTGGSAGAGDCPQAATSTVIIIKADVTNHVFLVLNKILLNWFWILYCNFSPKTAQKTGQVDAFHPRQMAHSIINVEIQYCLSASLATV
jgi:hypothetical protein